MGRLVYEYKKVEISKLNELDKKKRGDIQSTIENSINNAKKQFPWIVSAGQNNYVEYNSEGKSKPLLKSVISKYVEDKKFFSFEDIFNFIKKEGYEIREKSVRAYITKHCAVANEDANKFCHYDFVNEYSSYTWSNRQQSGILNWTINEVRSILMQAENHTKSLKEITTIVKEHAKDKYKIRDIRSLLFDYIGEHEVFNIKSEGRGAVYMSLTSKGLVASEEDWKKIGVRNRKPAYYEIVVSKIVSLLKEAQNCEMRLSELRDMCKDDMDSACFTQFYKIVDNELPEQIEKVEYEGLKYLRFKKEQIRYEPIAIIDNQSEITSGPKYVTSIESKPERSYGQIMEINWNQFLQTLNRETLYYSRFWDIEKISMSQALEVFVNYIQGQSSSRISKHIPRKLLLVWDYNSDIYDRKELLNELAICYEELLRLIHVSNTGERLETNGIYNTYKNIPNINKWALDTEYDKNNIYRRYFRYIQTLRNKIAHGNDTNYNSVEIMQRIAENVSLYVYTIARFLKRV